MVFCKFCGMSFMNRLLMFPGKIVVIYLRDILTSFPVALSLRVPTILYLSTAQNPFSLLASALNCGQLNK